MSLGTNGNTLGKQKSVPATAVACDPGLGMEPLHQGLAQGPPCPLPRLSGKGLLAFPCHQTQAAHDSPHTLSPGKRNLRGHTQNRTHRFDGSRTALQGTLKIPAAALYYIPGFLFQGGEIPATRERHLPATLGCQTCNQTYSGHEDKHYHPSLQTIW